MSKVGRMKHVIKKLVLRNHSFLFFSGKLRGNRIQNTYHRKVVLSSHRLQTFLKIPVICKYGKQEYHRRSPRQLQYLTHQTLIAVPFGLISLIIHRKLDYNKIRLFPLTQHISVKTDHSKLRWGSSYSSLDESDIIVPCKSFLKQLICLIRITLCVNRHRPCPLCDGPSDKSKRHFFSGSRFLNHFPDAVGISQVHKTALHHLIIFFRMEIHFFFCQIFRCRKSVV